METVNRNVKMNLGLAVLQLITIVELVFLPLVHIHLLTVEGMTLLTPFLYTYIIFNVIITVSKACLHTSIATF